MEWLILCNRLAYANQLCFLHEALNAPLSSLDFYVNFDYEDGKAQSDFNTFFIEKNLK